MINSELDNEFVEDNLSESSVDDFYDGYEIENFDDDFYEHDLLHKIPKKRGRKKIDKTDKVESLSTRPKYKSTTTPKELEHIFKTSGLKSTEFYYAVRSLVYYVVRKFYGEPEEDLINSIFEYLYVKLVLFDSSKGNLASFVYFWSRHGITKYLNENKKTEIPSEKISDLKDQFVVLDDISLSINVKIDLLDKLNNMNHFQFSESFINKFIKEYEGLNCENSIGFLLKKHFKWNSICNNGVI